MKQAAGEPQYGPLALPLASLQRLGTSSDAPDLRRSNWDHAFPGSLESRREKRWPPGVLQEQQTTQQALPVGPCKLTFYLLFYLGVVALFTLCMVFFFCTLSDSEPKYKLDQSLVGTSPGLGFRPMLDESSTLITYRLDDAAAIRRLEKELDTFLEPYGDAEQESYYYDCDYGRRPPAGRVCKVNVSRWSRCTSEEGYGFRAGSPCVFVKLNRVYDWMPVFYNRTPELPKAMPGDLRAHIQSIGDEDMRNVVWLSCAGVDARDARSIGPLSYVPERGFPGYFYPYRNQRGYLSPLVAVRFERPKRGVTIKVQCRAWARNIVHNREGVLGMVLFQLMIE